MHNIQFLRHQYIIPPSPSFHHDYLLISIIVKVECHYLYFIFSIERQSTKTRKKPPQEKTTCEGVNDTVPPHLWEMSRILPYLISSNKELHCKVCRPNYHCFKFICMIDLAVYFVSSPCYTASISYVDLPRTQPKQSTQSKSYQTTVVNLGYFRTRQSGEGSTGGTARPTNDVIK